MAYNPGVSFFIPFHELDPSEQSQCIFFTQKGARCRWTCQESHNKRAIEIHQGIIARLNEAVNLNLLQEYVLCNCCTSGRARHRDRIEDVGLLIPLAQRWHDEIQKQAADKSNHITAVEAFKEEIFIPNPYATPATSPPRHTTIPYTPIASPSYANSSSRTSFSSRATPSKSSASSTPYEQSSPMTSGATEFTFQPFGGETRYDLRDRGVNIPTNSISDLCTSIRQISLSEFRPHIAEPLPSDFVSEKILEPLRDRDFETGSLYIFDRTSSPGHVKIGWTARSVKRRLEDWSNCGYTPNLLFSTHSVPHAQRAETLTHHELIKEWRRERMCKAEWCRKSHQEWFEISKERAAKVLEGWAEFIRIAEPYDSKGSLKSQWKKFVEMMTEIGETVTAMTCLEHYKASIDEEETLINESISLDNTLKVEEQDSIGYGPKIGGLENFEKALKRLNSLRVEQQTLRSQIPPLEIILPKTETPLKSNQPFIAKPPSGTEPLFSIKSLSKTPLLFAAEPRPKTQFSFAAELPSKTQFSFAAESPSRAPFSFAAKPASKAPFSSAAELPSKTQFSFEAKPPSKTPFSFAAESPSKTQFSFVAESPSKTQFSFAAKPPSKIVQISKNGSSFFKEPLIRAEALSKSEPIFKEVLASKRTPVNKELLSKKIPQPSPLSQSTALPKETFSHQETKRSPSADIGKPNVMHAITNSNNNISVVDTLISPKTNLSVSASTQALVSTINTLSATTSEDSSQMNVHLIAENSNKSQPLNSLDSSSGSNPSHSSVISASPRLNAKLISNPPAPPGIDIVQALLSLSVDEQDEVARTLTSVTQRRQNVEGDEETGDANALLRCAEQTREKETEFTDQNESTVVEDEMKAGSDGCDEDETLVEDQEAMFLEMATLKIVDGLCSEYSTRDANGAPKGLNGLKVLDIEAPPALECVLQA